MHLDGELPRSQFHFLWPNLGVNIFPGRPNISIGPMVPLTPDRTYRFLDYFFGPDVDQAWIDELMAFDDQVGIEDRVLVEGVHAGIAAGGARARLPDGPQRAADRPLPAADPRRAREG